MSGREIHLERRVGAVVHDVNGRKLGHLEEVRTRRDGDDLVVVDYLVGSAALLERLSLDVLGLFGIGRGKGYVVPWREMDLENMRTRCAASELERF